VPGIAGALSRIEGKMKYFIRHFEDGYQVFEKDGEEEILIASFHRDPQTESGKKSSAQRRAEEYCDLLNQKDSDGGLFLDLSED
jgi:hypothetical protein